MPDLVLLDIVMPVVDGFAVLALMKANSTRRDIPVIIIFALNGLQSISKGIEQGAEDYLPKPFEPLLLHARISSSLEKKRLRDERRQICTFAEKEVAEELMSQGSRLGAHIPAVHLCPLTFATSPP